DAGVLRRGAGKVLLGLFLRAGDDGGVLAGDAVALGAVTVAADREPPRSRFAGREHDAARDAGGQVLLKDAAVDDLTDQGCHTRSSVRRADTGLWSGGPTRGYPRAPRTCQDRCMSLQGAGVTGAECRLERGGGAGVGGAAALAELGDDAPTRLRCPVLGELDLHARS